MPIEAEPGTFQVRLRFTDGEGNYSRNYTTESIEIEEPASTLLNGLLGYFRLEDNQDDASGNDFVLPAASPTYGAAKIGNGLTFTSGGYIETMGGGDASISAWMLAPTQAGRTVIMILADLAYSDITLDFYMTNNSGTLTFNLDSYLQPDQSVVTTSGWHHVVLVAEGGTAKGYLDGQEVLTNSYNDVGISVLEYAVNINSGLDEVALYNRALTADEVLELYNSGDGLDPTA